MHRTTLILVLMFCLVMLVAEVNQPAAAQSAAGLNGTVRDASGAVIPDANVKLNNVNTGVSQNSRTNSTGAYTFVNIAPGRYVLEAMRDGFRTERQPEFSLEVNQTATVNFSLQVGSSGEVVTVTSQAIDLETSPSELGSVVGTREVRDLPLNGRNFTELLLLTPGASAANPLQNAGGAPGAIGSFAYPAINGQSNRSNMFLLDGVNNYGGLSDTNTVQPTIDDVLEFKVQSHV
jgi:hypothetical protein